MKKNNFKILIFYFVLIAGIIVALTFMFNQGAADAPTYSDVLEYFQKDTVKEFVVDDDNVITMTVYNLNENGELVYNENGVILNTTKTVEYQLQSLGLFVEDCSEYYQNNQNLVAFDIEPEKVMPWWVSLLPYVLIIVVVIVLV